MQNGMNKLSSDTVSSVMKNIEPNTDFPFECGKATVFEDNVVIQKGFWKKKSVTIPLAEIQNIQLIKHNYWIKPVTGYNLNIGSPNRNVIERLKEIVREQQLKKIAEVGSLTGTIPEMKFLDRFFPVILIVVSPVLFWHYFGSIILKFNRLPAPFLLVVSLSIAGFGLMIVLSIFAALKLYCLNSSWQGDWKIDREGFWRIRQDRVLSLLQPVPGDGIRYPDIRFGGKSVPVRIFKCNDLFMDLLALHLQRAGAEFSNRSVWPKLVRSLIVPLIGYGWWLARAKVGAPITGKEASSTLMAIVFGMAVFISLDIYVWWTEKRGLALLLARLGPLREKLNW